MYRPGLSADRQSDIRSQACTERGSNQGQSQSQNQILGLVYDERLHHPRAMPCEPAYLHTDPPIYFCGWDALLLGTYLAYSAPITSPTPAFFACPRSVGPYLSSGFR